MKEKDTKQGHGDHKKDTAHHKSVHDGGHHKDDGAHHKGGHDGQLKAGHEGHHRTRHDSHHKVTGHHGEKNLKGAAMNASPTGSSHPIRPRAGTLTHRNTAHSLVSSKDGGHHGHHSDRRSVATSEESPQNAGIKYENTFKLQPDFKFQSAPVKQIIHDVIKSEVSFKSYDPVVMSRLCVLVSDMIKEKIKQQLTLPRFKIISSVMIGERGPGENLSSMLVTSRCLWDQRFDNHVTVTIQKSGYYVVATVFAVYAE